MGAMEEDIKGVHKDDPNKTLGITQRYNFYETYKSFTAYAGFSDLPQKLKELGLDYQKNGTLPELNNIQSKDEIIKMAIDMLAKIDPRLKTMAMNVMSNSHIDKNGINLTKANNPLSSTGHINKDADGRIVLNVNANRDVSGVIAVAQTLIDAGLYCDYFQHADKQTEKKSEFARDTAKKFIGYAMIDAMANEPYMDISSEQRQSLINSHLRQDFSNVQTIDEDKEIFQAFLEEHQDIDLDNMDESSMNKLFEEFVHSNSHPEINDLLNDRIKDIADEGKTTQFIIGETLKGVVALETIEQIQNTPDADPIKKLMQGAINGLSVEKITGKTPEELANGSPELINNMAEGKMNTLPENAMGKDQELVMEMIRQKNNNINNPS